MKSQVWVYISVVILSVGAGVAIAGIPESVDTEPTIQISAATDAAAPDTDEADNSAPDTAVPDTAAPATAAPDTAAPDTGVPATEPDTSTTTPRTTTTTTTTPRTTTTTLPLPERSEISVQVANGANVGGAASRIGDALEELGYRDIGSFDGDEIVEVTVIYAIDGFQGPAERLAEEMGLESDLIFPIDGAPDVPGLGESTQLLVYLGRDVESLPIYG